jgi:hypothetical protein
MMMDILAHSSFVWHGMHLEPMTQNLKPVDLTGQLCVFNPKQATLQMLD